ncbi:HD domain-containing protein [Jidongwangia harbinensis]|uniref:HD domain-containing protein n=1 Tax=Jidongwangia harbinensis TaxID=2878561 RepID=UPI001CD9EBDB|nr:HD domain-containing protein [Jidongwangia harbinensis]MCA2216485.1 HD domain-containing protein [Jidongwangia harbinensis]
MIATCPPRPVSPLRPRLAVAAAALCTVAQQTAAWHLGPLGDRWRHTVAVAECAAELAGPLGLEADVLVAAAWLHDIGSAPAAVATGFPPLDGARYLRRELWPVRVAALVAHHSGARFVATARGLGRALAGYPRETGLMPDALTYADQTVDPAGRRVTPDRRRAEALRRYGAGSWYARADHVRGPHLRAAVARVERRLGG